MSQIQVYGGTGGGGGGNVQTLTGNTGGAVPPTGNNINVVGDGTVMNVAGNPGTSTLTITAATATIANQGVVELATDAEAIAGADTSRAIVPSSLAAKLGVQTANAILLAAGSTNPLAVVGPGTDGQLPIGQTGGAPMMANLTAGTGVTITNGAGSITINATGGGLTWNDVTDTSANMAVNNGYVANNAMLVTLTLPATAAFGTTMEVRGLGAGLFSIAQNAGQQIHLGNVSTTSGAGGSITATHRYDVIEMVCVVADTTWSGNIKQGNPTIV